MPITSLDQLDPNGTYTYADYWSWQFPERVELLRGKVRLLETPMRFYHKARGKLFYYIANALWKKTTEIYLAPFDVRLTRSFPTPDDEVYTVVQPAFLSSATLPNWTTVAATARPTSLSKFSRRATAVPR